MVRKHLGKGLKALIPDESPLDLESEEKKFIELNLEEINPSSYQARAEFIPERMEELKNSIR